MRYRRCSPRRGPLPLLDSENISSDKRQRRPHPGLKPGRGRRFFCAEVSGNYWSKEGLMK